MPLIEASDGDAVVLAGLDPVGTTHRVAAWRVRRRTDMLLGVGALVVMALSFVAFLNTPDPFWVVPMFTSVAAPAWVARRLIDMLRLGHASAWWRVRADRRGIFIDRLFGAGRPPTQRVLNPRPSRQELTVAAAPEEGLLEWVDVGDVAADGRTLHLGNRAIHLHDASPAEVAEAAAALNALKSRVVTSLSEPDARVAAQVAALVGRARPE